MVYIVFCVLMLTVASILVASRVQVKDKFCCSDHSSGIIQTI